MSFNIETPKKLHSHDVEAAAELTALGFGRDADEHNLRDTAEHLESADCIQFVRSDERLVGFAAYRRLLWRPSC